MPLTFERKEEQHAAPISYRIGAAWWWTAGFALVYFSDVLIRASEKYFWFDELLTFYFSRLPNLAALWTALKSGIDFNPPGFYLLTHGFQAVFGYGLVGTRMPEVVGFFVFSVCLFRFVSHRAGVVGGIAAMLFPMLTGAYFYAYEARPHGVTLGCCGLALACWQIANERGRPARWLALFALSLFAAFMMHCYALLLVAPFAITELYRAWKTRGLHAGMWIALIIPAGIACVLYIPLLRAYRGVNNGSAFSQAFPAIWEQVRNYYAFLLDPAILIVILAVLLLLIKDFHLQSDPGSGCALDGDRAFNFNLALELVLAASFLILPVLGVVLGKLINGPFFARYFLSALTGFTILIGFGAGLQKTRNWAGIALTVFMASLIGFHLLRSARHRVEGYGDVLVEPSSGLLMNTTPGRPLETHLLLRQFVKQPEPIVVVNALDYLYLAFYAPRLAPSLFFVGTSPDDFAFRQYEVLPKLVTLRINAPQLESLFLRDHPAFLVYGTPAYLSFLSDFLTPDYHLESFTTSVDREHFLARIVRKDRWSSQIPSR